jgi:hypothetical protein
MKRFPAVALCLLLPLSAGAKRKPASASKKPARVASVDERFSYGIPKGFERAVPKNAIAGWKNGRDRTVLGVYPVSAERKRKLGSAFKAAKASRAKALKKEDWTVTKVYKKTLESGMNFLFYLSHQNGKNMQVSGYFLMSGEFYFVRGWISRRKYGLPSLYAALDTIQPISAPRRGRAMAGQEEPSLLKKQRNKGRKEAPAVKLGTGSGTPKMLGGPKKSGGPVQ